MSWFPPDVPSLFPAGDSDDEANSLLPEGLPPNPSFKGGKVAIIVYPSYDERGSSLQHLLGSQLLQPSLATLPRSQHIEKLWQMFADAQFHVRVLQGCRVTREVLKSVLTTFAGMQPEVLAVVFCGHGIAAPMPQPTLINPHGTMVLSGLTQWSSDDMGKLLRRQAFTGTLITFLNMCHAAPQQPVAAGDAVQSAPGSWASHGQPPSLLSDPPPPLAGEYRWVLFSSCSRDASQTTQHAQVMLDAFIGANGKEYKKLAESWHEPAVLGCSAYCSMGASYSGTFPGSAM